MKYLIMSFAITSFLASATVDTKHPCKAIEEACKDHGGKECENKVSNGDKVEGVSVDADQAKFCKDFRAAHKKK